MRDLALHFEWQVRDRFSANLKEQEHREVITLFGEKGREKEGKEWSGEGAEDSLKYLLGRNKKEEE